MLWRRNIEIIAGAITSGGKWRSASVITSCVSREELIIAMVCFVLLSSIKEPTKYPRPPCIMYIDKTITETPIREVSHDIDPDRPLNDPDTMQNTGASIALPEILRVNPITPDYGSLNIILLAKKGHNTSSAV